MKIVISFTKHPARLATGQKNQPILSVTLTDTEWQLLRDGTSMVRVANSLATGMKFTAVRADEQLPTVRRNGDVYTVTNQGPGWNIRIRSNYLGWPDRPTTPSDALDVRTTFAAGSHELILRPFRRDEFVWQPDFSKMRFVRRSDGATKQLVTPAAKSVDLTELSHAVQTVNRALADRPEIIASVEGRTLKLLMEIG